MLEKTRNPVLPRTQFFQPENSFLACLCRGVIRLTRMRHYGLRDFRVPDEDKQPLESLSNSHTDHAPHSHREQGRSDLVFLHAFKVSFCFDTFRLMGYASIEIKEILLCKSIARDCLLLTIRQNWKQLTTRRFVVVLLCHIVSIGPASVVMTQCSQILWQPILILNGLPLKWH